MIRWMRQCCAAGLGAILLLVAAAAEAQTLHAVVIVDCSPAAGWGKYEPHLRLDFLTLYEALHGQLPESRLEFHPFVIEDDEYSSPAEIEQMLAEVTLRPADTLLVYFSGHGSNDDRGQFLQLARGNLYRSHLRRLMQTKGARLNVLITDCCNSRSDGQQFFSPFLDVPRPSRVSPLFHSLFFVPAGWVDIISSAPGESAFFTSLPDNFFESAVEPGSLFTKELGLFWKQNRHRAATWDQLVRQVSLGVMASFKSNYPKGASIAKGAPIQTEQNVHAIEYPGMPARSGPRTGLVVLDAPTGGAAISRVVDGSPATNVYHLASQRYHSLAAGQVIVECNGQAVADAGQFAALAAESPQIMRLKIRVGAAADDYLIRLRY